MMFIIFYLSSIYMLLQILLGIYNYLYTILDVTIDFVIYIIINGVIIIASMTYVV